MFLGRRAQEQWPEIWDVVGALALIRVTLTRGRFLRDRRVSLRF